MTELWDIYDEHAKCTGRTMQRGIPKPGDYMLCVHIFLYNSDNQFLIQKRAMSKETHPGEWDITGGAVLSGEESIDAAIRETGEEIGIFLKRQELYYAGRIKKKNRFVDIYFVKKDFNIESCILQKEEVSAIKLVSANEIIDVIQNRKRNDAYISLIYKTIQYLGIILQK